MTSPPLLVTGGAGFIGSCFVAQAAERGHKVVVLDALTYAGYKENLAGIECTLVHGDIRDRALVLKLLREHRIESIVHLAAESHVDNSIAGPQIFIDTNITGTFQLLEACREYAQEQKNIRFLQVSTDEVYGSLGAKGTFSEASAMRPNSPYSASKAASDHLARAWCETFGLPIIITHCTNNFGPRQHPEKLIPHMISCALVGKKLPVYGDGKNVRSWLHVEDHCDGLLLALAKGNAGEVYDFGGEEIENIALVKMICALLDKKRKKPSGSYAEQIRFVTDRPGHDRRYAVDDRKAQKELGFKRRHTLAKGLEATVEWYLAQEEWCEAMRRKA